MIYGLTAGIADALHGRVTSRIVFLLALCACSSKLDGQAGVSCEDKPDPHCDHPIDRLLVPKLRTLGSEPRDATNDEVCRRMAIDLLGRGPTPMERTRCRTQTFAEMARTFVSSEDFVRTRRRAWGELAHYESLIVWGPDIVDLDDLVGQLYREQIDYAEFVHRFAMHPAFWGLHPGDSWIANVFAVLLGRPARQDEIDAARPLTHVWVSRPFCGREVFWNFYQIAKANGADEAAATAQGNTLCFNGSKVEFGINLCRCKPALLNVGCVSDVFGPLIRFTEQCDPVSPSRNDFRYATRTPTTSDLCPDNVTHRPECQDRALGMTGGTFKPFVAWPELPPSGHAELRKVGAALVARPDLWEAAVDRELRDLLGWWQATFKHPDSDLPEVRALLVERMRAGDSVRDIIELIVTSQLYVQPATAPNGLDPQNLPPWAAGPSKLLSAENWLATAAVALGETAGTCDFRFGQQSEYAPQWIDPRLVDERVGTIDSRFTPPLPYYGYSIDATQRLGGCTGDAKRPQISNIGLAFAQANIARELCAVAPGAAPPGDLRTGAATLVENAWNRVPTSEELDAITAELQACVAAGPTTGCADARVALRWLCRRLIDSVEFSTY